MEPIKKDMLHLSEEMALDTAECKKSHTKNLG